MSRDPSSESLLPAILALLAAGESITVAYYPDSLDHAAEYQLGRACNISAATFAVLHDNGLIVCTATNRDDYTETYAISPRGQVAYAEEANSPSPTRVTAARQIIRSVTNRRCERRRGQLTLF